MGYNMGIWVIVNFLRAMNRSFRWSTKKAPCALGSRGLLKKGAVCTYSLRILKMCAGRWCGLIFTKLREPCQVYSASKGS